MGKHLTLVRFIWIIEIVLGIDVEIFLCDCSVTLSGYVDECTFLVELEKLLINMV